MGTASPVRVAFGLHDNYRYHVAMTNESAAPLTGEAVLPITWRGLAQRYPEFVQFVTQRHGGLPDGPIRETDYQRFAAEYQEAAS